MNIHIPIVHRVISFTLAAIVIFLTVEMIRRRKLREEFAMIWLLASAVVLTLAIFPAIPFRLQRMLNVNYLTIILLSSMAFIGLILMHFATELSKQAEQIRQLAEHSAILQQQLQEARKAAGLPQESPATAETPESSRSTS